ncbi:hypothetical protein FCL47_15225 [Desulfopila sp. IMCC35006]|uniref:hypothetical protein n=1 Tax=Desulfopila sp. IMCC35006 TaxID=2569542 RepID=UPI0010ABEC8D|nr:hypothetical protein [Desulfopila sp. IMCC35006]TKB25000.1 hypothetical protein FCL47_15225 [Desulfopila sp. IMCC35006]
MKVRKKKRKLAYGALGITAIVFSLFGYWLKSNIGIDYFEKFTLSKFFPFKYLIEHNVIDVPVPGILLDDSFDSFSLLGNWTPLWLLEKG